MGSMNATLLTCLFGFFGVDQNVGNAPAAHGPQDLDSLPHLVVESDDTRITESCRIVIPAGLVIEDANANGVLHIEADGIRVVFTPGSVLRGAPHDRPLDELRGTGIVIEGHTEVLLVDLAVEGFHAGLVATDCDWLYVDGADFDRHFAQRLRSTPAREASEDWLWPHANDSGEWLANYGASVSIADSDHVRLEGITARHAQNGILLSRVGHSTVEASDASYLSGWGLAMWRSSDNRILGNRFDYDVRGYSHGVYNRGQDSAGILAFEQCSRNLFLGNSATHCGDGFFGFSGKEALGEVPGPEGPHAPEWFARRGNNSNVFEGNDFSYAAAHGLELTFGFGNIIRRNVFRGNAICGIWGGFSQDTLIEDNLFSYNGAAGYGAERGGINIDHARGTLIRANRFGRNALGVRLWRLPSDLEDTPWGRAQSFEATGNHLVANTFVGDEVAVELVGEVELVALGNEYLDVGRELVAEAPAVFVKGPNVNTGRREDSRAGRESIRMTEWGPWDGEAPIATLVESTESADVWSVAGFEGAPRARSTSEKLRVHIHSTNTEAAPGAGSWNVRVERADRSGAPWSLLPYDVELVGPEGAVHLSGMLQNLDWTVKQFASPCDPREDLRRWRQAAEAPGSVTEVHGRLRLAFGQGGPLSADGQPMPDRFGTIAKATVRFPAGDWVLTTTSDDGVRVAAMMLDPPGEEPEVWIENWTYHGPTTDTYEAHFDEPTIVELVVEHFELDGYAWLEVDIQPHAPKGPR